MRIDTIRMVNFKCFENREFSLAPRFNLVIGDNATGKTTVLDGLAVGLGSLFLGFPSPATARSLRRNEVRSMFFVQGQTATEEVQFPVRIHCVGEVGGRRGNWTRELTSLEGRTTRQHANWIRSHATRLHTDVKNGGTTTLPLISYYGTGRLWVQLRQKVKSLSRGSRFMGYRDCLNPASDEKRLVSWFKTQEIAAIQRQERIAALESCRQAILDCVPEANRVYFDVSNDQLMLGFSDRELPFDYLSDGFRNMLAMAADIAVRCASLNPALQGNAARETPGVVLIDEIDLHLHPKWQRRVVGDLLRAFPRIQFVATTHSPFVIQSLPVQQAVRLINLDNESAGQYANMSVEDISEEVQGVDIPQRSKRFIDMMETAKEYYALLENASGSTSEELEQLRKQLDELSLPFSDDPAYQAFLRSQRVGAGLDGESS